MSVSFRLLVATVVAVCARSSRSRGRLPPPRPPRGHARRLLRLRLRHLRRPVAASDERVAPRLQVRRHRHLRGRHEPRLLEPAEPHPEVGPGPVLDAAGGCFPSWSAARPPARHRATTAASGSRPSRPATTPGPAPRAPPRPAAARRPSAASASAGGSVIWFDLEHFDLSNRRCRASAMAFTSAWTRQLHRQSVPLRLLLQRRLGHPDGRRRAGVGVAQAFGPGLHLGGRVEHQATPCARRTSRSGGGGRTGASTSTAAATSSGTAASRSPSTATCCRTGAGTRPGKPGPSCGVRLSFRDYRRAERGDRGARSAPRSACSSSARTYGGKPGGRFGKGTAKAVRRFQRDAGLRTTGDLTRATWTALLARGAGGQDGAGTAVDQGGQRRQRRTTGAARAQRRHRGRTWEGRRSLRGCARWQR